MRLIFAGLVFALVLACGSASALSLASLSAESVHLEIGKSTLVKTYIKNPDSVFANITVWLGGDYPTGLAKFSTGTGFFFSGDMRTAKVGLNPKEERVLNLVVISTGPKDSGYTITLDSNTTASLATDSDSLKVFIDYAPGFPALDFWSIILIITFSGFVFWLFL